MELKNLEIYKLSRKIGVSAWGAYYNLSYEDKKVFGHQFITAIDSIGANIAEGFGRFHYLDRNKFNYNARGSLFESIHWLEVMRERGKIDATAHQALISDLMLLQRQLNAYITVTKERTQH